MGNTPRLRSFPEAKCRHGLVICAQCIIVTDAAKRMSDAIGLAVLSHSVEQLAHGWMAFALEDGSTDHTVYPSKAEAVRHQSNEFLYCYLCLARCLGSIPVKDAQIFLDMNRHLRRHGGRIADPDEKSVIMPIGREQMITRPTWKPDELVLHLAWMAGFRVHLLRHPGGHRPVHQR